MIEDRVMVVYIAVDPDGSFWIFDGIPERVKGSWLHCGNNIFLGDKDYPEDIPEQFKNLTWMDEPVRVQMTFDITSLVSSKQVKPIKL